MTNDLSPYCGTSTLTTTNAIFNGSSASAIGGSITGQTTTGFVQTCWPYTPPATTYNYWPTFVPLQNTEHAHRIAELEGEVKVLREMMAAMLGGWKKPAAKPVKKRKV